jgi:hypothetical protein
MRPHGEGAPWGNLGVFGFPVTGRLGLRRPGRDVSARVVPGNFLDRAPVQYVS